MVRNAASAARVRLDPSEAEQESNARDDELVCGTSCLDPSEAEQESNARDDELVCGAGVGFFVEKSGYRSIIGVLW